MRRLESWLGRRPRGLGRLFQQFQDFARARVPPELRFLENGDAVALHLEASAARRDQLDVRVGKAFLELGRQTGGA